MSINYYEYLESKEWKAKRQEAFAYYGERCSLCGKKKNLQVHHIHYKSLGNEDVKDLTILCGGCHVAFEKRRKRKIKKRPRSNPKHEMKSDRAMIMKEMSRVKERLYSGGKLPSSEFMKLQSYLRQLQFSLKSLG